MQDTWVSSVSKMSANELRTLMRAHYPRVCRSAPEKGEHEALTGHSVHLHGWRHVFGRRSIWWAPPGPK